MRRTLLSSLLQFARNFVAKNMFIRENKTQCFLNYNIGRQTHKYVKYTAWNNEDI